MKRNVFLALSILGISIASFAQEFLQPIEGFSTGKRGYLYKKNDEKLVFTLRNIKLSSGVITGIVVDDTLGNKLKFSADEIKLLALPPSKMGQWAATNKSMSSISKLSNTNSDSIYKKEFVYFLSEFVEGKDKTALLQLINPSFCNKIKVFHDPYANETSGFSVGGIAVTGGEDKSYYVKYKDKTIRLKKRFYDDKFNDLYGSCNELIKKYKSVSFSDFAEHVYFYDQSCK